MIFIITVKEFCEKYKCAYSPIYKKLKSKKSIIAGHVFKISGKTVLDDYAESVLKPDEKRVKSADYDNLSRAYSEMEYRLNRQAEILREQLNSANEEIAFLKNRTSELEEKCMILESENAEIKKELEQKNAELAALVSKPKGFFSRR